MLQGRFSRGLWIAGQWMTRNIMINAFCVEFIEKYLLLPDN